MAGAFEVKTQKILGSLNPQEGLWSIPYEFCPEDAELLNTRGHFFMVIDFSTSPNVDLQLAAKIAIDEIKESYYGDLEGTPLQALESAVQSGKSKLLEISKSHASSITEFKFNIVCAVVWGRVLYIAQVGETSSIIIRQGKIIDISNKTGGEVITSSGLLESDDVVILGTSKFEELFLDDKLTEKIATLEEQITKSSEAPRLSIIVFSLKKTILPAKKDLMGFFGFLRGKKDSIKDTKPASEQVLTLKEGQITSLGEIPPNQKDLPKSENNPLKPTLEKKHLVKKFPVIKFTKTIRIFTVLLALISLVLGFALFNGFGLNKYFKTPKNSKEKDAVKSVLFTKLDDTLKNNPSIETLEKFKSEVSSSTLSESDKKDLLAKVNIALEKVAKDQKNIDKNLVFDFAVKNKNPKINSLDLLGENSVFVSDLGSDQAYIVDLTPTQTKIKDIALGDAYLMAKFVEGDYYILLKDALYIGDSPENLKKYSLDTELSSAQDFEVYYGNLYVLSENKIYKYIESSSSYTQSLWAELPESGSYYALSIDGSIYIASSNGVLKYFKGEKQEFSLDLDNALDLYSPSNEGNPLYVLDSTNTVFLVNKEAGTIQNKYTLKSSASFNRFAVSKDTIYVSDNQKLYKFSLEEEVTQ